MEVHQEKNKENTEGDEKKHRGKEDRRTEINKRTPWKEGEEDEVSLTAGEKDEQVTRKGNKGREKA